MLKFESSKLSPYRSSRPEVFYENRSYACSFIKKETGTGVFLWILRNFAKHLFTEHLWTTAFVLIEITFGSPDLHCYYVEYLINFSENIFDEALRLKKWRL